MSSVTQDYKSGILFSKTRANDRLAKYPKIPAETPSHSNTVKQRDNINISRACIGRLAKCTKIPAETPSHSDMVKPRDNINIPRASIGRLAKCAKIPAETPSHSDTVKPRDNINIPQACLKPEYSIIRHGKHVPLSRSQTPRVSTISTQPSHGMNRNVDSNNNSTASQLGDRRLLNDSRLGEKRETSTAPEKVETLKEKATKCICFRPKAHILCTICGYSSFGNIRTPCYAHVKVTYLLHLAVCPRCNSGRLMEVSSLIK